MVRPLERAPIPKTCGSLARPLSWLRDHRRAPSRCQSILPLVSGPLGESSIFEQEQERHRVGQLLQAFAQGVDLQPEIVEVLGHVLDAGLGLEVHGLLDGPNKWL